MPFPLTRFFLFQRKTAQHQTQAGKGRGFWTGELNFRCARTFSQHPKGICFLWGPIKSLGCGLLARKGRETNRAQRMRRRQQNAHKAKEKTVQKKNRQESRSRCSLFQLFLLFCWPSLCACSCSLHRSCFANGTVAFCFVLGCRFLFLVSYTSTRVVRGRSEKSKKLTHSITIGVSLRSSLVSGARLRQEGKGFVIIITFALLLSSQTSPFPPNSLPPLSFPVSYLYLRFPYPSVGMKRIRDGEKETMN